MIREDRLGLTFARLRSFHEAAGEIILYIDDDNVLSPTYMADMLSAFDTHPEYGAIGGKSLPAYETSPPPWFAATGISLACRDLGEAVIEANWPDPKSPLRTYPACAPIGAGMAVRRVAYEGYVNAAANDARRTSLGRKGSDLASGEDNDMVLSILSQGWTVAYRPELSLQHLIPAGRLTFEYLKRYARSSNRTWVQVLELHGLNNWPGIAQWTLPLRVARTALRTRPWRSEIAAISFMGQRGLLEGQALIYQRQWARR